MLALKENTEELNRIADLAKIRIRIIGCGGGGTNILTQINQKDHGEAKTVAINTDASHLLKKVSADGKILIGKNLTRGMGAGNNPEIGKLAALESQDYIKKAVFGQDVIFIVATLGGGTGTGSAPIVAKLAKENRSLVFSIVTLPFESEGKEKMNNAKDWLPALSEYSDVIIIIPNQKLEESMDKAKTYEENFSLTANFIMDQITGLVKTINDPGRINIDYQDLKKILLRSRSTFMAIGKSSGGEGRIDYAISQALKNSFINVDISKASGCLLRLIGSDIELGEYNYAMKKIIDITGVDCEIIGGVEIRPDITDGIYVFMVLTGVKSDYIIGNGETIGKELFGNVDAESFV